MAPQMSEDCSWTLRKQTHHFPHGLNPELILTVSKKKIIIYEKVPLTIKGARQRTCGMSLSGEDLESNLPQGQGK